MSTITAINAMMTIKGMEQAIVDRQRECVAETGCLIWCVLSKVEADESKQSINFIKVGCV